MLYNFIPLTLFEEDEAVSVRSDLIVAVHDSPKVNLGLGSPPDSRSIVYLHKGPRFVVKETHAEIMSMISDPLKLRKAVETAQQMVMEYIDE
tara:strand:- start:3481 stop:3756 length:276 start_codon:yes stop_codon:yes gene_type:complete